MASPSERSLASEIAALRRTLRVLRGKNGCPWDREQKLDDIVSYLIEESYELLRAERIGRRREIEEELGDVVFIVVFVHELLLERGGSSLAAIVSRAHRKIVNRHPHVFGSTRARTSAESLAEWERIKRAEKRPRRRAGILDAVDEKLPPLRRAAELQKKAAEVGFDWPDSRGILDKLGEETAELERELRRGDRERIKDEIGDLFFTVVNLARWLRVDSEGALERTMAKFVRRFGEIERRARRTGIELGEMSLEEMEALWQASKRSGATRELGGTPGPRAARKRPRKPGTRSPRKRRAAR